MGPRVVGDGARRRLDGCVVAKGPLKRKIERQIQNLARMGAEPALDAIELARAQATLFDLRFRHALIE